MANFGDIENTTAIGALQSIRRNSGDTAFEAYNPAGYTINVAAINQATPVDGTTYYFGGVVGLGPQTVEGRCRVFIPKTGTIKAIYITSFDGAPASNEAWSMYIRLNATTDTLIETTTESVNNRRWTNTGLSIAVTAGDSFEIKSVNPTWATDAANVRHSGIVYIET